MSLLETLMLPIIVATIAAIPGLYALIQNRKKAKAEAEKIEREADKLVAEAAASLVEPLTKRVNALEKKVAAQAETIEAQGKKIKEQGEIIEAQGKKIKFLESTNDKYRIGTTRLVKQVRDLGHEPVWETDAA